MKFNELENLKQLSEFLKIDEESLIFYLDGGKKVYDHASTLDENSFKESCVEKMYIPKKNKRLGLRTVYSIKDELFKNLNKVIFLHINQKYEPLDCVQGFVKKRNVASNAFMHLGKKIILNIDIKNFFESINKEKVMGVFKKLGCKDLIAKSLAELTTLNDRLALGFNTSPVIANLVLEDMDRCFLKLAEGSGCIYTRYADDICFSSNDKIPDINVIKQILKENDFSINEEKTKIMTRGKNQYVTGLTIFDEDYPRIPRRMKKKIRLLLHYYKKYGIFSHIMHVKKISIDDIVNDMTLLFRIEKLTIKLFYKIRGWVDYVNSVEPILAEKYYNDCDQINIKNDSVVKKEIMRRVKIERDELRAGN